MRQKIFKSVSIFASIAVLLAFVLIVLTNYRQMVKYMENSVQNESRYVKAALENEGEAFLTQEVANASTNRLTLIDTDGTVLYDSNKKVSEMESHEDRPEVMEALQNETGEDSRVSASLGSYTYYYAIRLDNGQVIRVSATIDSIWKTMAAEVITIAAIILLMLVISLIATSRLTKKLVEPINQLDLEHPLENEVYEELSPLLRRIHKQNDVIEMQVNELRTTHQEYVAITDNMKDGLIVTNRQVVLSMNKAAQRMYRIEKEQYLGRNILFISREEQLKKVWDEAVSGDSSESTIEKDGKTYRFRANPVLDGDEVIGAVILILDVTEKEQAEKRRREFSANVSHELKTPLMSISGYAELIQNNMVKQKDVPEFAGRIRTEAVRLSSLVEDIIRLSQLDELSETTTDVEDVDLLDISQDVKTCLEFAASQKNLTFEIEGESVVVRGVRQIIYEMLYNLCDNAIRYNKENGSISVKIAKEAGHIIWSVKDTGIGIAREDQDRIFERFYRVDKSHSRETGGTGLGLSIVKHGAFVHRAKIELNSEPGNGTEIVLKFEC